MRILRITAIGFGLTGFWEKINRYVVCGLVHGIPVFGTILPARGRKACLSGQHASKKS